MFRPIRVDHTNCLQVAIKTHSFVSEGWRQTLRGGLICLSVTENKQLKIWTPDSKPYTLNPKSETLNPFFSSNPPYISGVSQQGEGGGVGEVVLKVRDLLEGCGVCVFLRIISNRENGFCLREIQVKTHVLPKQSRKKDSFHFICETCFTDA